MTGTKSLNPDPRSVVRIFIGLFLTFPFLVWLVQIHSWAFPSGTEWLPALGISLAQAAVSAAVSLVAGWLLFLGLQSVQSERGRRWAEFLLLFPNMIPPLFLVLGLMNLVTTFMFFPYGFTAVVVAHVLMNAGLVAIALDRLVHFGLGGMAESAWVLGASRSQFWRRVAWPVLRADVLGLFLFLFSVFFTSFSIPVLLSGTRAVTLEVAIFDAVRIEGRWDKAVILAGLQSVLLLGLAGLLPRGFWPPLPARRGLRFLGVPALRYALPLAFMILSAGWLSGFAAGIFLPWDEQVRAAFLPAVLTTLAIAMGVGVCTLLLFLAITYATPHRGLERFLNGYLSPSPVITGFALLLLPLEGELFNILKIIVALTLIFLPMLYRWLVHASLAALANQVRVARLLGATWGMILFDVVWPQVAAPVLRASGLAAVWASGDFALSAILADDVVTLPLLMESLISSYRMESAQVLMVPLLLAGGMVYFFFVQAARYVSR